MQKNRTTVLIDGREYPVTSTESVEHMEEVARIVDEKIKEIRHNQAILNPQVALVFAALNLADDLLKMKAADHTPPRQVQRKNKKS